MSGNNKDFKVKNGIKPTVYHEGLGTVVSGSEGYNLAGASYDSKSFSVVTQEGNSRSLFIKPDGLSFYITGVNNDTVYQYTMSTAWDISTGTYASKSLSVAAQELNPNSIFFKPDGTKLYVMGASGDDVNQYTLSTAWDISTATFDSVTFSVASQETTPNDLQFKSDGTKLYVSGFSNKVYQYSLSTAWDVSTASYDTAFADVSGQGANIQSTTFSADGSSLFVSFNSTQGVVYSYSLSTAWDASTASYTSVSFTPNESITGAVVGLVFGDSGNKMYLMDYGTDLIYQYSTVQTTATLDLSTGSVFEVTPTSDIQVTLSNPAASGTVSGATLLLEGAGTTAYDLANGAYSNKSINVSSLETTPRGVAFNSAGTKLYMIGSGTDSIYQYSLSTAFDLDTAVYDSVNFSVASQATNPYDVAFNKDGTKLYVLGLSSGNIYQYSLSTAFDLSSASYDSVSFSISGQDTSTSGMSFNGSGTKLYTVGAVSDSVYQYSLSTAFDLSTASYDSVSFSVTGQDGGPSDITFNSDGTKLYMLGNTSDSVYQYSLSTAFDLSTASYDSVSFSVAGQETTPQGLTFSSSGKSLYVIGTVTDAIYQYSTATPATITYDTAIEWPGGTAPTSPAIGETDVITFNTRDGGSTYSGVLAIDGAS